MTLSASALSLYRECPLCFWLARRRPNVYRPRPPFPTLPQGVDQALKAYYDSCRRRGFLPREIEGRVEGVLFPDQQRLDSWRDWRQGLRARLHGVEILAVLDDLLILPDRRVAVLDYKTRGTPPRRSSAQYHQAQMDLYTLVLRERGLPVVTQAYLVYYWPGHAGAGRLQLHSQVVELDAVPQRAEALLLEALHCLDDPNPPSPARDCDWCGYVRDRNRHAGQR